MLLVLIGLTGCPAADPPRTLVASNCSVISGARDATLRVVPPAAGTLVVSIEQSGITVVGTMTGQRGEETTAASAVERFGRIALIAPFVTARRPVAVRVSSLDPQNISGQVCMSALLVQSSDRVRLQAEQSFAEAGKAVHARQWETAFNHYLAAAKRYESLGLAPLAISARHSMAELAYSRLYRDYDSYVLTGDLLSKLSSADPLVRGVLTTLYARTLADQPGLAKLNGSMNLHRLLSRARELFHDQPLAKRELPRLDILQAFVEYSADEPAKAASLFTHAADQCRELGDWQCYARARQNSAAIAEEQKNYATAMQVYEEALQALAALPVEELSADISDNLGRLQGRVGLFGRSEQTRKTAMRLYAQLGDCAGARRSLASLGMLLMSVGSMGDASTDLEQAVSFSCPELLRLISGRSEPQPSPIDEENGASSLRFQPGQPLAQQPGHCTRVGDLGIQTGEDKRAVFDAFVSLSNALLTEGDTESAKRCMDLASEYAVTSRAQMRLTYMTGVMHLRQQKPALASRSFGEALRIADAADLPQTYVYRGYAHLGLAQAALLSGKPEVASREALHELRMSSARADVGQIVASLQLLAGSYRDSNQRDAAIRTLRLAVKLIDQVPIGELDGEKRATYLATQHAVFSELTELLIVETKSREQAAWEAFEVSELGRARSLRYAANQTTYDRATADAYASEDYRKLLDRVRNLSDLAAAGNSPPVDLLEHISKLDTTDSVSADDLDAHKIIATLNQLGSTLVEYAAGEHDMFAFVIDRGRLSVTRVGSIDEIARAATRLNDQLRSPEPVPSHIRSAAQTLAQLVLWPITANVTTERIIFVPDDALHTVPFAVLPWSENSHDQLVVHRAETSLLASALLLTREQTNAPQDNNRFTLLGDPVFRVSDWQRECSDAAPEPLQTANAKSRSAANWAESLRRLPGTRTEVLSIAKLVQDSRPSSHVHMLIRCAATSPALRAAANEGGALLHIATHGRIDANRPRLSALALTPDNPTDATGAFSLLDILNLTLHSRLVVLSACDTSRGRLLPGEGVLGLAQAFLQAGAASVVASFWRVQDDATAAFMTKFYEHLIADRLPASAALRRAQLDQASTDATYSWAAFSLYGSPDTSL